MATITDDMKHIIARAGLSFVATVCPDGTPNLSPKATLMVFGEDHLVFANIRSPQTVANLRENPAIEINVVDIFLRRGYRFKGRAELVESGPAFDLVTAGLWSREGPKYPVSLAVKIRVEHAAPVLSPAYIFGDPVATEDELKETFLARYGVRQVETQAVS